MINIFACGLCLVCALINVIGKNWLGFGVSLFCSIVNGIVYFCRKK